MDEGKRVSEWTTNRLLWLVASYLQCVTRACTVWLGSRAPSIEESMRARAGVLVVGDWGRFESWGKPALAQYAHRDWRDSRGEWKVLELKLWLREEEWAFPGKGDLLDGRVSGNKVLEDDVQSRPFYEPQFFEDRAGGGAEMRSAPYHPALANVAKLCNLKHAFRRIQPYKQNGSYSTCRASCYCTTLGGLTMQPTFNGLLFNKPTIVSAQPPKCWSQASLGSKINFGRGE